MGSDRMIMGRVDKYEYVGGIVFISVIISQTLPGKAVKK
jgi:hypothetical protein